MKRIFALVCLLSCVQLRAADVAISGLTAITSPSTNTWLEVSDMNASPKSRKYLLTNLVTVVGGGYQATNANLTLWSAIAPNTMAPLADPTFTGTVTVDLLNVTTLTADNWVLPVLETNKLVGIGISTNPIVATSAMVQDTLGQVYQSTNGILTAIVALSNANGALTNDGAVVFGYFQFASHDSTNTFTNKTFDATGTGNVLKQTKYLTFMRPDWGDGAGAVPQTNTYTASGLMHYSFSGNAETNANYVLYEGVVPPDLDTAVDMKAVFGFKSGGTDADTVTWHIAYGLGAAGSAYPASLAAAATSPLEFAAVTPTTPASGDYQETAELTLTGWAASMTPGKPIIISIRRLQDSNDDAQTDVFLRISYGSTQ